MAESLGHLAHEHFYTTPQRPDMGISVAGRLNYSGDRLHAFCFAFILARHGSFHGFPGFDGEDSSLLGVAFAPLFEDCADTCEEAST